MSQVPTQDEVDAAFDAWRDACNRRVRGERVEVEQAWLHFCRLDDKLNGKLPRVKDR